MTSDTTRRHPALVQAEEKYPHYVAPSWEDGAIKDDVMPSVDASWQNADADMQRAAFLAGWEAHEEALPSRDRWLNTLRKQISELPVDYGTTRMGEPKVSLNTVLALFKGAEG